MKKRLILAVALTATMSATQALDFSDIRTHHCYYANMVTELASGVAHAIRVNAMDSKKKTQIKNAAMAAMIASGLSIASKALGLYKARAFDINYAKDLAEFFNAYLMHKNAKGLAKRNRNLTQKEKDKLKLMKTIMFSMLAVNRPVDINDDWDMAEMFRRGVRVHPNQLPLMKANHFKKFLLGMAFPIFEYFYSTSKFDFEEEKAYDDDDDGDDEL